MKAKRDIATGMTEINTDDAQTGHMPQARTMHSSHLFDGAKEVFIAHLGELYQLSITKQKKLLLTKVKQEFAR